MNSDKVWKRALSLVMALMLVVGLSPMQAFATEQTAQTSEASKDASIVFEVEEQLEGDVPAEDPVFYFILEAEKDGEPLPASCVESIEGEGMTEFDAITFTEPGRYNYLIRQEEPDMSGYTHDETIYYMTVKVVRENGRLIATVSGYKDRATSKADAILYINEYEKPDEESKPGDEESSKPTDEESSKPSENESSEPGGEESSEPSENESSEPSGEESSKPNNEDSSDSQNGTPDTGDQAQSLFWMILMAVAAIGLILGMKYHMTIQKRESK